MIDLARPALHAAGVTVFPDHADPTLFHYLPDAPRLRLKPDGTPELLLLKYKLDPSLHSVLGAGVLSFTVDLNVDDATIQQLTGRIARQFSVDKPVLSPVLADSGSVQLMAFDKPSDDPNGLIAKFLGAAAPSLYGDEAATFMVVLQQEGAVLVEQALRGGAALPIGVVYSLEVLGLRPAIRATITAKWQDIYDYYDNDLHGGKILFATDVGATIEKLKHDEKLQVSVDNLLPPDQQQPALQAAINTMQSYVIEKFFQPTLGTQPPADDGTNSGPLATIGNAIRDIAGFFTLNYTLKDIKRDELKTLSYQLNAAAAEQLTLSPQGTIALLLQPTPDSPKIDVDKLISTVDASVNPEMDFDVGTLIDLEAENIDHVSVTIAYGSDSRQLTLDKDNTHKPASFVYDDKDGLDVHYHYIVGFKAGAGTATSLTSADTTTEDRVIRLDPRELYQRVTVRVIAQGVPWDRYPTVIVDLQGVNPTENWQGAQTLTLDATHGEQDWSIRAGLGAKVQVQRRIRFIDNSGAEAITLDWDTCSPGPLIIGDPQPPIFDLQILGSAQWGTKTSAIIVEVRPTAHIDKVSTFKLNGQNPSATWSYAFATGEDRTWEYRVTVYTALSEVQEGPWVPGPVGQGQLHVGPSFYRLRPVTVTFLGKSLSAAQLFAMKFRFQYDDADNNIHLDDEFLVQDTNKQLSWAYPVADLDKLSYQYTVTLVHAPDGTIEAKPPVTASDQQLVYIL